jgi:hypothetical protein
METVTSDPLTVFSGAKKITESEILMVSLILGE